ncbi:related to Vhc1p [Saccharomycodes ludwigii]|uniref:Related to Vhc1p n=1 Tax=Saccharomycodes ludwigii TaxID=36035 RepID=A0A376B5B1_9ASCO|nr:related to Vhc1p [Saccharomycodes ludwigii]
MYNFGVDNGVMYQILTPGKWHEFLYATLLLAICFAICMVGSQLVSRAGTILFWLLLMATFSIPISALLMPSFDKHGIVYTGFSFQTLKGNLLPHFTKGAAGSLLPTKEKFNDLFGIFFPATAGIFAGAGMSSELRKPSKSIPKGTIWGLLLTFVCYSLVIISLGATVPRKSLHLDVSIIQTISGCQVLILLGELATSLFSVIVGIVGAAYVLEAISKDRILPGLTIFSEKPITSLLLSWLLTQLCLFSDVNQIATFITMAFLMTFIIMNLACFLLEISSAPNFRPSFNYFDRYTAFTGGILSVAAMFVVDGISAVGIICFLLLLFLFIHYTCPPKTWGDVSQNLIYHQVRKYLLLLKQDNVKYWRPQILLLVDNPRSSWTLIKFCNNLKKGGLYILGHVITVKKANTFQKKYNELTMQKTAWVKVRDYLKIKAFVHIGLGPTLQWGVRNVFLGSGLGGMKPNITVLGLIETGGSMPSMDKNLFDLPDNLPTDECGNEDKITVCQWVQLIEDLSLMESNIAVAKGFYELEIPQENCPANPKKFIDLYPIQMSAKISNGKTSSLTTNFDTYTLILQLGAILNTVPAWQETHTLRCIVFVENEYEKIDEFKRVTNLLNVLRIEAEICVLVLSQFKFYNTIVKGDTIAINQINKLLSGSVWWKDLCEARKRCDISGRRFSFTDKKYTIKKDLRNANTVAALQRFGVSLTMSSNMPTDAAKMAAGKNFDELSATDSDNYNNEEAYSDSESDLMVQSLSSSVGSNTANRSVNSIINKFRDPKRLFPKLTPVFSSEAIPETRVVEDASGDEPSLIPVSEQPNGLVPPPNRKIKPQLSPCQSNESLVQDLKMLSFNNIPRKAQLLILNDLMTQMSGNNHRTNLVFSTLPLPLLRTHEDMKASQEYVDDLNLWLDGLPPTLLINSQSMTVTTAL